ncbi:MAG: hypothetical protein SFY32_13360 [Bacteroidota bacterium]|nr:hypothetical protein [Bacteroidota bacterium]
MAFTRYIFLILMFLSFYSLVNAQKKAALNDYLTKKIEARIAALSKTRPQNLKKQDIDTLEAWVNQLNKKDLEKSLKYYPKVVAFQDLYEKTQIELQQIARKNNQDIAHKEYYTLLSILEEEEKLQSFEPKDLIEIINRCLEIMSDPDNDLKFNEKLYYWRGKSYYAAGDYYTALINFKKVQTFKNDTSVYKPMAMCYLNMRSNENARKYIDMALNIHMGDEEIWYAKYILDMSENKRESVFNDLKTLLIISPGNIRYLKLLGDYYFSLQEYPMAIEIYRRINETNPQNSFSWLLIANCYLAMNERNAAISMLQKAESLGNNYASIILDNMNQNFVYVLKENTSLLQFDKKKEKILMLLNTGFKVRIVDTTKSGNLLVSISNIEGYSYILGYIHPSKLAISLLSIDSSKVNNKTPYIVPEKSVINNGKRNGIFFEEDRGTCYSHQSKSGFPIKINPDCEK